MPPVPPLTADRLTFVSSELVPHALSAPEGAASAQSIWFQREVHTYDEHLKAYLRGNFPAIQDVDDVVQVSYLRIWKARLIRPILSTKSFLFTTARNIAFDLLRRRERATTDVLPDVSALLLLDEIPDAGTRFAYQEQVELLADAFDHLPPRCFEILTLRKLHELTHKEIARKLGISEATVESQVNRGLKLLRAYLSKRGVTGFSGE